MQIEGSRHSFPNIQEVILTPDTMVCSVKNRLPIVHAAPPVFHIRHLRLTDRPPVVLVVRDNVVTRGIIKGPTDDFPYFNKVIEPQVAGLVLLSKN